MQSDKSGSRWILQLEGKTRSSQTSLKHRAPPTEKPNPSVSSRNSSSPWQKAAAAAAQKTHIRILLGETKSSLQGQRWPWLSGKRCLKEEKMRQRWATFADRWASEVWRGSWFWEPFYCPDPARQRNASLLLIHSNPKSELFYLRKNMLPWTAFVGDGSSLPKSLPRVHWRNLLTVLVWEQRRAQSGSSAHKIQTTPHLSQWLPQHRTLSSCLPSTWENTEPVNKGVFNAILKLNVLGFFYLFSTSNLKNKWLLSPT